MTERPGTATRAPGVEGCHNPRQRLAAWRYTSTVPSYLELKIVEREELSINVDIFSVATLRMVESRDRNDSMRWNNDRIPPRRPRGPSQSQQEARITSALSRFTNIQRTTEDLNIFLRAMAYRGLDVLPVIPEEGTALFITVALRRMFQRIHSNRLGCLSLCLGKVN